MLECLKAVLRSKIKLKVNHFVIETGIIEKQLGAIFDDNVSLIVNDFNPNTTNKNVPKYLHWFEWEKRELHIFDVVSHTHNSHRLQIFFKIPCFSRSVMTPSGAIYLMGGEDIDSGAKKETYLIDSSSL